MDFLGIWAPIKGERIGGFCKDHHAQDVEVDNCQLPDIDFARVRMRPPPPHREQHGDCRARLEFIGVGVFPVF